MAKAHSPQQTFPSKQPETMIVEKMSDRSVLSAGKPGELMHIRYYKK
jgi:hypothetical protein